MTKFIPFRTAADVGSVPNCSPASFNRALLAILSSEIQRHERRSPDVGGAGAAPAPTTPSHGGPNPALSTTPLSRDAAAAAARAAAAALDGAFAATVATNASSAGVGVVEAGDNPSSGETQAGAAGPSSPSTPRNVPGAVPAPAAGGEGAAAGGGGSSAAGEGGEVEKKALETAWNLYLQVML